jgi:hypothetical protein
MASHFPESIVRAPHSSAELRVVLLAAMLNDIPVRAVDPNLEHFAGRPGPLPVGSVEFVKSYMTATGIQHPAPMSYPASLDGFLGRKIDLMPLHRVRGDVFIKPRDTKLFNGFVWRQGLRDSEQSDHELEQLELIRALDPDTLVWAAEPIRFQSEWRYYVTRGQIVGESRYDADGDEEAPVPNRSIVEAAIDTWLKSGEDGDPDGFGIDFAVDSEGRTILVEVNDGWSLGYYGEGLLPRDYLTLLWARWVQIAKS